MRGRTRYELESFSRHHESESPYTIMEIRFDLSRIGDLRKIVCDSAGLVTNII